MASEKVNIVIKAVDKTKSALNGVQKGLGAVKSAVFSLQGALLGLGAGAAIKSIITVASEVESLQIRLKFLTGSTEDAAKAFDTMNKFAAQVPFSLADIERASPSLLTVADSVDELNTLLEITGDIAAISGLKFDETAMQLQRALSSGIASADLFRERGVAAFLGFQSGVSVSAEETKKRITEMWRDGTTTAVGATKDLSKSFMGQVSMMEDAWREMKLVIADAGIFEEAGKVIIKITTALKDPKVKEGVQAFSKSLLSLFKFMVEHKDALILIGSIYLGAKIGSVFGKWGIAIGAATAALIAFNKEIKEFFGFGSSSEIDQLNIKIANTLELITALQGNSIGMVGDKSNAAIDEANKKLAEYRLQIALINEELLAGQPPTVVAAIAAPEAPKLQNNQDFPLIDLTEHMSFYDMLMSTQDAHYKELRKAEASHLIESHRKQKSALEFQEDTALLHQNKMVDLTHKYLAKQSAIQKASQEALKNTSTTITEDIIAAYKSTTDSIESTLTDAMMGTKSWGESMKDIFRQVAREYVLTNMARPLIKSFTNSILPSFAGGGFTGGGSRSGGVDGKGGFNAVLHPNETVIDHTKQQGNGSSTNISFNIQANDARGFDQLLQERRGQIVGMINQAMNENGQRAIA